MNWCENSDGLRLYSDEQLVETSSRRCFCPMLATAAPIFRKASLHPNICTRCCKHIQIKRLRPQLSRAPSIYGHPQRFYGFLKSLDRARASRANPQTSPDNTKKLKHFRQWNNNCQHSSSKTTFFRESRIGLYAWLLARLSPRLVFLRGENSNKKM